MDAAGPSQSTDVKRYKTAYKKQPGTLIIAQNSLNWIPDVAGSESVSTQQLSRIISMFTSKAGAAKTSAKFGFIDDRPAGGLLFQFTSPSPKDVEDRQELQDHLTKIIGDNKKRIETARISGDANVAQGIGAGSLALAETAGPSSAAASRSNTNSRTGTPSGAVRGESSKVTAGADFDLKRRVLDKHPTLKALFRELALTNLVTDKEFWEGRHHLIEQERLLSAQRPGISSRLLDDRFGFSSTDQNKGKTAIVGTGHGIAQKKVQTDSRGEEEIKINVTKDLQDAVFREFPIVQEIYVNHVGPKDTEMNEQEFWARYFRSKLWDRHRASARAGGSTNIRADAIFDMYLEAPDDAVEPREAPKRSVDMFLDLAATEEDHQQTGNERDVTMQPGKQKATLPLIRRFNDHSNRLVALDDDDDDDMDENAQDRLYSEIEMEDLRSTDQYSTIALDVQGQQSVFDGNAPTEDDQADTWRQGLSSSEIKNIIMESYETLHDWQPDLPSNIPALPPSAKQGKGSWAIREGATEEDFSQARKAAERAVSVVTKGIEDARQASMEQIPIPQAIMAQILTCHNAHTEFLRQFWSAILPSPPGALGQPTAEQKMTKARKMAGYLKLMAGKVDGVVQSAKETEDCDPERVREALQPTLQAAEKALAQFAVMFKK